MADKYKSQYPSLPSYENILQEIKKGLKSRKGLIGRRLLKIIWPGIVSLVGLAIVVFLIVKNLSGGKTPSQMVWFWPVMALLGIWVVFTILYYMMMSWVFGIEKHIWVISYFDDKSLSPDRSWEIAKKLAFPALKFKLKVFLRFYLLVFIGYPIWVIVFFFVGKSAMSLFLGLISGFILGVIYLYYLRIKLRFLWFLFLDSHGKEISFLNLLKMNEKLNEVKERESFNKALKINLGATSVSAISQEVMGQLGSASQLGGSGGLLGQLLGATGQEASKQMVSFGKIIATAMLYRYAWMTWHNERYQVNEYLHKL